MVHGGILVPGAPVQLTVSPWQVVVALLVKVRDAGRLAFIADGLEPVGVCRSATPARLPAVDHPLDTSISQPGCQRERS